MQITAYVVEEGRFKPLSVDAPEQLPERAVWVRAIDPTEEECIRLAAKLGFQLDIDEAARTLETYGHVEVEGDQLTVIMQAGQTDAAHEHVTSRGVVLMSANKLLTLRTGQAPAFESTAREIAGDEAGPEPSLQVVILLLSNAMQVTSKILDGAEADVHRYARALFNTTRSTRAEIDLENLLSDLGSLQTKMVDLRYRHRLISRIVEIVKADPKFALTPDLQEDLNLVASDAVSLRDFTQSIDDQLSRLMESTIGFIGIRQNASARWFSIVATVFMPPTLLGAVWGMNFKYMPELDDPYSYTIALTLMLLSATIPLWIVRKMGWLGR